MNLNTLCTNIIRTYNINIGKVYLPVLITCFTFSIGNTAFQFFDVGARPLGMAGAFTGLSDDANATVWNVAGIARVNSTREFTAMYAPLSLGMIDNLGLSFVAGTVPLGKGKFWGVVGLSYLGLGSELYSENVILISYARYIPYLTNVFCGVNFKYLHKQFGTTAYSVNDPTFSKSTVATGITYDIGILYLPIPSLSIAMVGKNITEPQVSLLKRDVVPAEYRLGIGYTFKILTLTFDWVKLNNVNRDTRILCGSELWVLKERLGVRGGIGYGTKEYKIVSLGASYRLKIKRTVAQIDYAFSYSFSSLVYDTGSHYFSFGIKF